MGSAICTTDEQIDISIQADSHRQVVLNKNASSSCSKAGNSGEKISLPSKMLSKVSTDTNDTNGMQDSSLSKNKQTKLKTDSKARSRKLRSWQQVNKIYKTGSMTEDLKRELVRYTYIHKCVSVLSDDTWTSSFQSSSYYEEPLLTCYDQKVKTYVIRAKKLYADRNNQRALEQFSKALTASKKVTNDQDSYSTAAIYSNLAVVRYQQGMFKQAITFCKQSLKMAKRLKALEGREYEDWNQSETVLRNWILCLKRCGEQKAAEKLARSLQQGEFEGLIPEGVDTQFPLID